MEFESSIRSQALAWWRELDENKQTALARWFYPDMEPILVITSSSKIEHIYKAIEELQ